MSDPEERRDLQSELLKKVHARCVAVTKRLHRQTGGKFAVRQLIDALACEFAEMVERAFAEGAQQTALAACGIVTKAIAEMDADNVFGARATLMRMLPEPEPQDQVSL